MRVEKITVPGKQRKYVDVKFRCDGCQRKSKVRLDLYRCQLTIDRLIAEHRCG